MNSLIVLLLLLEAALLVSCASVQILDKEAPIGAGDIEGIARLVCETNNANGAQIGRVSTIKSLKEFFEALPATHQLAGCKRSHEGAVRDLDDLLAASNQNVCSDKKISLLERFHEKYISTNEIHKQKRKEDNLLAAPTMLRLFFMNYAMEVDTVCKKHLINHLEWDLKENFGHVKELQLSNMEEANGGMLKAALEKFSQMLHVNEFDDVVLFWPLLDGTIIGQKVAGGAKKVEVDHDKRTGEPIRLMAKVKLVGSMEELRANCLNKYKPIYSKLILPIIRLADMGYANKGDHFKVELEELRNNQMVKQWYSVTQLCEAVIPMKFYEDPSMEINEIVLITKEEAQLLESQMEPIERDAPDGGQKETPIEYEPSTNSMEQVDFVETVGEAQTQALVAQVDTQVLAKSRSKKRALVHMFRYVKGHFKGLLNKVKVFFSKPKANQSKSGSNGRPEFEERDVAKPLETTLDKLNEKDLGALEGGLVGPVEEDNKSISWDGIYSKMMFLSGMLVDGAMLGLFVLFVALIVAAVILTLTMLGMAIAG